MIVTTRVNVYVNTASQVERVTAVLPGSTDTQSVSVRASTFSYYLLYSMYTHQCLRRDFNYEFVFFSAAETLRC